MPARADNDVGPMRPVLRRPIFPIPCQVASERLAQPLFFRPAPVIGHGGIQSQQPLAHCRQRTGQALKIGGPLPRQGFAGLGQLRVPDAHRHVRQILLECGISLPERLVIALPRRQERVFHVEHTPVQKPPAAARTLLQKLVNFRIDDLWREMFGQLRRRLCRAAADPDLGAPPASPNPERRRGPVLRALSNDQEGPLALLNQRLEPSRTERPAPPKKKQRLEQAGLARGVRSDKKIEMRVELEFHLAQAAKLLDLDPGQRHCAEATGASASRRTGCCCCPAHESDNWNCRRSARPRPRRLQLRRWRPAGS